MDLTLNQEKLDYIVRHALIEDIGRGDITTQLTIPKNKIIKAEIQVKENCIVCGMQIAEKVFKTTDNTIKFDALVKDGNAIKSGKTIARISGNAASILSSERVTLNLLSMLSGIATTTREYVKQIEPYRPR